MKQPTKEEALKIFSQLANEVRGTLAEHTLIQLAYQKLASLVEVAPEGVAAPVSPLDNVEQMPVVKSAKSKPKKGENE